MVQIRVVVSVMGVVRNATHSLEGRINNIYKTEVEKKKINQTPLRPEKLE